MSLVINHNMMAMTAARNLGNVYNQLATSTQRLSSGLRVNSAADDAAGLAVRELMRSDIAVINQGVRNASDGISMIQTAEGAMSVIDEKLIRMKELAEQSATGTYTTAQREIMNSEYQAMGAEIDRIANATNFNGVKLLDGSLAYNHSGSGMKIHFGTGNSAAADYYFIKMGDMRATQQTGLRVGNSDANDVFRTTALNAASPTTLLNATAGTGTGLFGIQYSKALDTSDNPVWNMYGYVAVDPNHQTLSDVVTQINQGAQAHGAITFGSVTSTALNGESVTVGGQVFTFSTAMAFSSSTYSTAGVVSGGTVYIGSLGSTASIAYAFSAELNNHYSTTGVVANFDTSTSVVNIFATQFGASGNTITTSGATSLTFGQTTLQHGGDKYMTASAYYDATNNFYQLQLSMDHGGDAYQARLFSLTSASGSGNVVLSTATVGYAGTLSTNVNGTSVLNNFTYTSADADWQQVQNGSGRTVWDGADILTQSAAQHALSALDTAIQKKDTGRASLGALQNRLQNTITNLQIQAENLQAAESRISDVDVATEMTTFTKNNILAQAATAMLAQANSLPQLALKLIG